MVFSALQRTKTGKFALRFAMLAPFAAGLGGCASQIPVFDSFFSSDPLVTGSITGVPLPFDQSLAREDWLTAEPALAAALDPANQDASTEWKQKSGSLKGSFRPVGLAFTKDGMLCRDFTALVEKKSAEPQLIAATACRFGAGAWQVRPSRIG